MLHNRAPILLPGGRPSIGRVPARVVTSEPLSAAQMAELNGLYDAFFNNCQLSLARSHVAERTMSDGTEVRMFSNQGLDTVLVRAVQADQGKWSAYPAYVDLSFTPVYDRPVVDMPGSPGPNCGDEPEFEPPPVQPPGVASLVVRYSRRTTISLTREPSDPPFLGGTVVFAQERRVHVEMAVGSSYSEIASAGGTLVRVINESAGFELRYTDVPLASEIGHSHDENGEFVPGSPAIGEIRYSTARPMISAPPSFTNGQEISSIAAGGTFSGVVPDGGIAYLVVGAGVPPQYPATVDISFGEECKSIYEEFRNNTSVWEQEYQAWLDRRETWLATVYQAWLDCMATLPPSPGPVPGIESMRTSARDAQVQALRGYLYSGVNKRHLAARLLSFPWNIATQPAATLPSTGAIAVTGPTGSPGSLFRELEYVASGADRSTEVPFPEIADIYDRLDFPAPPPPLPRLGQDIAMPTCLFGWQASGDWQVRLQYATFHALERKQTHDVESLSMSVRPDYNEALKKGVVKAADREQVICSDGYVPAETALTLVFFEYEIWDPFCKRWFWSPHTDLGEMDSIWVKSYGAYDQTARQELGEGEFSPRAVRVQKAMTQTRKKDLSWSAAKDLPLKTKWTKEIKEAPPQHVAGFLPLPSAVVIVEGLHPGAAPINGLTTFPFFARAQHSAALGGGAPRSEWADYLDPQELVAAAVKNIGVKP